MGASGGRGVRYRGRPPGHDGGPAGHGRLGALDHRADPLRGRLAFPRMGMDGEDLALAALSGPQDNSLGRPGEAALDGQKVREEQEVELQIDTLLDKISEEGLDSLTRQERAFLEKASRRKR